MSNNNILKILGVAAVIAVLGVYLYYFDNSPFTFKCPVKFLTGFDCPGCGSQRAIHSLLHGDIAKALSYNYFIIIGIPYACFVAITGVMKSEKTKHWRNILAGPEAGVIFLCLALAWTITRNIAGI